MTSCMFFRRTRARGLPWEVIHGNNISVQPGFQMSATLNSSANARETGDGVANSSLTSGPSTKLAADGAAAQATQKQPLGSDIPLDMIGAARRKVGVRDTAFP